MNAATAQGMDETVRLFAMGLALLVAAWVIADAVHRGRSGLSAFGWGLGVFLMLLFFLPLYLLLRGKEIPAVLGGGMNVPLPSPPCRYCGSELEGDPAYCPHCGKQLKSSTEIHKSSP